MDISALEHRQNRHLLTKYFTAIAIPSTYLLRVGNYLPYVIPKGQLHNLESRIESFHLNQKTNENIFVFLPYLQKTLKKWSKQNIKALKD